MNWSQEPGSDDSSRSSAKEDDDTGGMQVVLDRDERLLEVPEEAGDVADDEDVETATLCGANHRLPRGGAPGRGPARRRDRPLESGIVEAVALDGPVLLLALGVGAEVVPLAGGGLAEPPCRPHALQIVELSGQDPLHAAVLLSAGQGTVPRPRRRSTSRSAATRARTTGFMATGGAGVVAGRGLGRGGVAVKRV